MNFYNEIDAKAAAWLRELITAGLIPQGDVDERDIRDIRPDELAGYTQCHFFAGIGGWSRALELAGWPADRPVWTGSCPCQPFSSAGARGGIADERHLWPHWFHLISQCQPAVVFGEQVASKDGLGWFDLVHADLEGAGYAVGAEDKCAAGLGAPHIRQRLWFVGVADADVRFAQQSARVGSRSDEAKGRWPLGEPAGRGDADGLADADLAGRPAQRAGTERAGELDEAGLRGAIGGLEHALGNGPQGRVRGGADAGRAAIDGSAGRDGTDRGLADTDDSGHGVAGSADGNGQGAACHTVAPDAGSDDAGRLADTGRPRPTDGFWRDADWLFCRDGKWRPVEPGTFPLAHGLPARVGRLRGYGNAISPIVGADFIEAAMIWLDLDATDLVATQTPAR